MERIHSTIGRVGRGGESDIANGVRDVMRSVVPMATGSDIGMVKTTHYANNERVGIGLRDHYLKRLNDEFSPAERQSMHDAMQHASVEAQLKGDEAGEAVIASLPEKQQQILREINDWGDAEWEAARQVGRVAADAVRLPWYSPRMILNMEKPGKSTPLKWGENEPGSAVDRMGVNLTTQGPRKRHYLTPEETLAAAKAIDPHAEIIRDIRTLPIALERLHRATAGTRLVKDIQDIGRMTDTETVSEGQKKQGFFTLPHPALEQPVARRDAANNIVHDENGNIVWDKKPIYVRDDFKGPLEAVLRSPPSKAVEAFNRLKGGAMTYVMFTPTMHNFVIYGKAFPVLEHKFMFWKNYTEGNAYRSDPENLRQMISDGVVPISRRGYRQDVTAVADEPALGPGNSSYSRGAKKAVGWMYGPESGNMIAKAIDTMGHYWHEVFLWDRVADLQAGIYKHLREELIGGSYTGGRPVDPLVAGRIAGHFANRYAGVLPAESMSKTATNFLNLVLFSRTFTMSNLGTFKDMVNGLPRNIRADLGTSLDEIAAKGAASIARRKAWAAFLVDAGLFYALNAVGQTAFDMLARDKTLNQVEKEFVDRFQHTAQQVKDHPIDKLNPVNIFGTINSLMPQGSNEPHKQDRVLLGKSDKESDKGTASYLRIPLAKVSEDLIGWAVHPAEMLQRKQSTFLRPALEAFLGKKGFDYHQPVYQPDPQGITENAANLGRAAQLFFEANLPVQWVSDLYGATMGGDHSKFGIAKAIGPLLGFSVSKGAPGYLGGPDYSFYRQEKDKYDFSLSQRIGAIQKLYTSGQTDQAFEEMTKLGVDAADQRRYARMWGGAKTTLGKGANKFLERHMTDDERWRFEHLNRP